MGKDKFEKDDVEYKQEIITRLKRIEGQVKGIQKMIEEEKHCVDILTQVAAVRAAVNKVGGMLLDRHSKACIRSALMTENKEQGLNELVDAVQKFLKFVD